MVFCSIKKNLHFIYRNLKKKPFFLFLINNIVLSILINPKIFLHKIKKILPSKICKNKFGFFIFHKLVSNRKVRNYIKSDISIPSFFLELNKRDINYVILRWFEDLPNVTENEDLDILMNDDDIKKISDLVTGKPNSKKLDIYSITSLYSNNGLPYYPARIAKEILCQRVLYKDNYYIPVQLHYFLSLVYHILYHKGEKSGLLSKYIIEREGNPEHQYDKILEKMALDLNIDVEINLDSLHLFMISNNWNPPIDTLRKLSILTGSIWQKSILPKQNNDFETDGEVIVFIIREWAANDKKIEMIKNIIIERNLSIIKICKIDDKQKEIGSDYIRGGNWGRGPYPISGGYPSHVLIVFDYHPKPVNRKLYKQYPFVLNENTFIKNDIRDYFNDRMLRTKWTNCIHSSDDEIEAWDYIKYICPDSYDEIKSKVFFYRDLYKTRFKVIKLMTSHRNRSKVELIDYYGKLAIKKTYKFGNERFLQREIFVHSKLSNKYSFVPPLLESSDCYFIIPYYENIIFGKELKERNKIIKNFDIEILRVVYSFYQEGYALIDFTPNNILITDNNELKVVDFEFLYKYDNKPDMFTKSFDIKGVPKNFKGDLPRGFTFPGKIYRNRWKPIFNKTLENILVHISDSEIKN